MQTAAVCPPAAGRGLKLQFLESCRTEVDMRANLGSKMAPAVLRLLHPMCQHFGYKLQCSHQCSVVWWWRGNDSAKMTAGMQPVCSLGCGRGWAGLGWAGLAGLVWAGLGCGG